MSANILSSLSEENRDLRKQMGCMNGIFQLFDRHHLLTGRRIRSHNHKRILPGPQNQKEPQFARKAITEKELEAQMEKSRNSMESSRASYSSSCSSTFSSFDSYRTTQPGTPMMRQVDILESTFQTTSKKEQQPSLTPKMQSLDLRDVVKDSMYREARGLSIKPRSTDERRDQRMKYVDSPRPLLQQPKTEKPRVAGHDGSMCSLAKIQEAGKNNRDDRLALPRFSYDGRESREMFKSSMKLKELPRLSLDSKTSSMKSSSLASRSNLLCHNLHTDYEIQTNHEPGTHSRSSSVVAKLMGLEDFPDTISTYDSGAAPSPRPHDAILSQSPTTANKSKQVQAIRSPQVSENYPTSPASRSQKPDSIKTRCSTIPVEPAPWKQHDSSRGSSKMVSQDRKTAPSVPNLSYSVYGEIEKRITQLEFKTSGKDLRALKQILEAMQKTRERLEHQRGETAEFTTGRGSSIENQSPKQNSNFSFRNNTKNFYRVPDVKAPSSPSQLGSSIVIMRSGKVIDRVAVQNSLQAPTTEIPQLRRLQTQDPKYAKENSSHSPKLKDVTPKKTNLKDSSRKHPAEKKAACRTPEIDQTLRGRQYEKVENNSTQGRSSGTVSPRLQQNLLTREGQCNPTIPRSESSRVRKHSSKKLQEKGLQNQKHSKPKDLHLSDDQFSDLSSETRYSSLQGDTASVKSESNNSMSSQIETEFLRFAHSTFTNAGQEKISMSASRDDMRRIEFAVTIPEQPSPVSVLDAAFYSEDLPSPVKKISTVFQEDENPCPDEAEWNRENLNPLSGCLISHYGACNQKLDNVKHLVQELRLLNTEADEKAATHRGSQCESLNPDHGYINKILLMSGILKDTSFISTGHQFPSSCHLINPDMFHVLEQTESILEETDEERMGKKNQTNLTQKSQRKIVFDLVNEIMVRKITPGRVFSVRKKRISPEGLLKEVHSEIDHLQKMPHCNIDDEDDGLSRLLNMDMIHQSEDWTEYSGEVPALVLDIERLIFKDLINEIVTGEVVGIHDWSKRPCRQLFTK